MKDEKADRIFREVYKNQVNPFTPYIVERGFSDDKKLCYEISKQSPYDKKELLNFEYALTVLEDVMGVWIKRPELSGCHHSSITEARNRVNSFERRK